MIIASSPHPRKAFGRWSGIITPDASAVPCVWPYLSIWNALHQSRCTSLRQRGQHGPRSRTSQTAADVTGSAEQRGEVRLRSVEGLTLRAAPSTLRCGELLTGELISPHLHPRPLPSYDSAPAEAARTGSHSTCTKTHLQPPRLPTRSVITGQTD